MLTCPMNHTVPNSTLLCGLYLLWSRFLGSSKYSSKFNADSGVLNTKISIHIL